MLTGRLMAGQERMAREHGQMQGSERQACGLDGACASGDCVRGALKRLLIVSAVLVALALATGQWAWLMLAGLLLFTAVLLWGLEKLPGRHGA